VLFMSFPKAYAGAFSGLNFGLILVLWLLIGRGLALELRHQLESPLWRSACDAVFSLSSLGLALVFGVAIGNVVRGVPLNDDGYFSLPLFNILNWYGLLVGVFGLVVLATHGAAFLAFQRRRLHGRAFLASAGFIVGMLTTIAAGLYPERAARARGQPEQPHRRQRGGRQLRARGGARVVELRHAARRRRLRLRVGSGG
jgi:cytochrome bd ubiquinol oxidase subunit II